MNREFTILHLFCGIGGAALGFQQAKEDYRGINGRFKTLGGIDCDPAACTDFKRLTGAPAFCMDLFERRDYIAFHGKQPPAEWRERIGNAVPPAAAQAIAKQILRTLLMTLQGETFELSCEPIWVKSTIIEGIREKCLNG